MKLFLSFLKNVFSTLGSVLQIIFELIKFILVKSFKFIIAIFGAIIGIFITKKAVEKE